MNSKHEYICRMVGGMAVIAMPKTSTGQRYTRTEGKDGVIYLRPAIDADYEIVEDD